MICHNLYFDHKQRDNKFLTNSQIVGF